MADAHNRSRRYAILMEGYLADSHAGKTAYGVMRFRPDQVACVIDSAHAGKQVNEVATSLRCDAPVVAGVADALKHRPTSLLIGIATHGGKLPPHLRPAVIQAIDAGLEIVNGLHQFFNEDPEFVEHAAKSGARLWDVRAVDAKNVFTGAAYRVPQRVVLAVGSDCSVGKMTAMLEIERAGHEAGAHPEFLATGQTGIMISGWGTCVDRVISDFVTGASEQLVINASPNSDVLLVEGQGSIFHPAYAPVTFGLLYGSAPDTLLLCHRPNITQIDGFSTVIPKLPALIAAHEGILANMKPARVGAIALDTSALDAAAAARAIEEVERETGLCADDPVRNGGGKLWRALSEALDRTPKAALTARA
jgi:uncharacterized NAD-dependent epimerase/dehydratase family protein